MRKKKILILFILALLAFIPDENIEENEFPLYKVVIDPGHGGVFLEDRKKHGDKFDMITAEYLDNFAEGANYKGIYEHKIVYSIALKTINILSYCSKNGDFEQFKKIMKKYTDSNIKKIYIETFISRGDSLTEDEIKTSEDPNANYRLYDFPAPDGEMIKGRISKINEYKPHLVVSLHLAKSAPPDYKGMNGIIIPPYNVLKKGLLRLQTNETNRSLNDNDILRSWFKESNTVSSRYAFYKDSAQYFTSYEITKNFQTDLNDYNGYKYNMVTWAYSDKPLWDLEAEKHSGNSRYASDFNSFREEGSFWEREQSVYEEYRRGTGFKSFGGDNYFATYEIIKYILFSLNESGISKKDKIPGKPFVSTWSVPMLINAISAYIELGYLDRKWDREVLLYRQDEIAEGVAVGIYSLLTGIDNIKGKFKHKPAGKLIDLKKYNITKEKSYFDIVTE
jgi:hypothetical protein